jgi:hypothetical protein
MGLSPNLLIGVYLLAAGQLGAYRYAPTVVLFVHQQHQPPPALSQCRNKWNPGPLPTLAWMQHATDGHFKLSHFSG